MSSGSDSDPKVAAAVTSPDDVADSDVSADEIPQPTYVPAALAMGIMMLLWGILTNWLMSLAGAVLMAWAIKAWISEVHRI
ncbi:MAG: hypothetical protein ACR2NZ_21485 [Rubripirellula sp.]